MRELSYLNKLSNNLMHKINLLGFKFTKIFKQKKYLFLAVVLMIVAAGLIFPNNNVYAGSWDGSSSWSVGESLAGVVLGLISPIIYIIFYIFLWIAYAVAWIGTDIINITLAPSVMNSVLNISQGSSLYSAWAIFRDIANLLFILILLLVAFGTIFRSDTYNIKKSLPSIIIVAFLINFSAMITGLVIDFTNILMFGIFRMMCPVDPVTLLPSATCAQDFMKPLWEGAIDPIFKHYAIPSGFLGGFKVAASIAIASIYVFIFGLVLVALGVFFLIRIAAFALLVVLSPLAFFGQIAPGLKGISNKWWDNLLQYAFFGPIAALLLYVSAIMAKNTIAIPVSVFEANPEMSYLQQDISMIVANIIPLIFLFAIIPITRSMGIAGANAVMDKTVGLGAKVGSFAKSYATDTADRWLARGAQDNRQNVWGRLNRARAYLSPTVIKKAYKAHTAEQEHDYDIAAGAARERMSRGVKQWKKPPVDYKQDAYEREVDRAKKDILAENSEELAHEMEKALDEGMIARAEAIARKLAAKGDTNDAMKAMGYGNSQAEFVRFMDDKFKPHLGDEQTARLMSDVAQMEKKEGNHSFKGTTKYNTATHKQEIVRVAADREAGAAKEFGKVEPQAKWRGLDKRTLLDENTPGVWSLATRGEYILDSLTQADIDNVRKGKPEHLKEILRVLTPALIAAMPPSRQANAQALKTEIESVVTI